MHTISNTTQHQHLLLPNYVSTPIQHTKDRIHSKKQSHLFNFKIASTNDCVRSTEALVLIITGGRGVLQGDRSRDWQAGHLRQQAYMNKGSQIKAVVVVTL